MIHQKAALLALPIVPFVLPDPAGLLRRAHRARIFGPRWIDREAHAWSIGRYRPAQADRRRPVGRMPRSPRFDKSTVGKLLASRMAGIRASTSSSGEGRPCPTRPPPMPSTIPSSTADGLEIGASPENGLIISEARSRI